MDRGTVKTRTIFIATRGRTAVYRRYEEVPVSLRKRLLVSTSGTNSGTVLIADRRGLAELLHGRLRSEASGEAEPAERRLVRLAHFLMAHWTELALSGALGLMLWLAFSAAR